MYIYIVTVRFKNNDFSVSSEGYLSLKDAQKFIDNRSDNPNKVSDFLYQSNENIYYINEIHISGVNRGSIWKINNHGMVEQYYGR